MLLFSPQIFTNYLALVSVLEYIRNFQKPTRIQKNIENLNLESGVGKREIDADSAGEKVTTLF